MQITLKNIFFIVIILIFINDNLAEAQIEKKMLSTISFRRIFSHSYEYKSSDMYLVQLSILALWTKEKPNKRIAIYARVENADNFYTFFNCDSEDSNIEYQIILKCSTEVESGSDPKDIILLNSEDLSGFPRDIRQLNCSQPKPDINLEKIPPIFNAIKIVKSSNPKNYQIKIIGEIIGNAKNGVEFELYATQPEDLLMNCTLIVNIEQSEIQCNVVNSIDDLKNTTLMFEQQIIWNGFEEVIFLTSVQAN